MIKSISDLKKEIKFCFFCFNPFEAKNSNKKICPICSDPQRDKSMICLVEKEADLISLEKLKKYQGLYFILGGTISTFKKPTVHTQEDIKKMRIKELLARIKNPSNFIENSPGFKEIILATNPTTEGEATTLYLERLLKPLKSSGELAEPIKITRLGRGLPIGGELEYADEETLGSALEGRK